MPFPGSQLEISSVGGIPEPVGGVAPPYNNLKNWVQAPGLYGIYRDATAHELRRLQWQEHTLLTAMPLDILDEHEGIASIATPEWDEQQVDWVRDKKGRVIFERRSLQKVQRLALGNFVEHHLGTEDSSLEVRRPIFELYGFRDEAMKTRVSLLTDSSGALLLRQQTPRGRVEVSAPHAHLQLDVRPPPGYHVALFSPTEADITRNPLAPFDCENGECEDPDNPLDECNDGLDNDGLDNDGDGERDSCDWNCLPHSDFGAHHYPDAQSRVENGKSYALMGGGTLCTGLGETWMVTFADWALQASELLNDIRPNQVDSVHYRLFSCWVFEDRETALTCQHGYVYEDGVAVGVGPSMCPPGMEGYPYRPADLDLFPGLLFYDEALDGARRDHAMTTLALGSDGEPINGVGFLSDDTAHTCKAQDCLPRAGLATLAPEADVWDLGRFVATNANANDWVTLAHETGHTIGLVHDDAPNGFMGPDGVLPLLGTSTDPERPGYENHSIWSLAFESKHSHPRSSGWSWTGCYEVEGTCAPLGKPGWTCEQAWCEPE